MFEFLYQKRKDISYDLLCGVYSLAVLIGITFYVMESQFGYSAVEGYWIIMAPFFPCLLWGVLMKSKVVREDIDVSEQKKKA